MVDSVYARLRRLGFFVLQTSEPSVSPLAIAAEPRPDLTLVPLPRPLWNDNLPADVPLRTCHPLSHSPLSFRSTSRVPTALTSLFLFLFLPFRAPPSQRTSSISFSIILRSFFSCHSLLLFSLSFLPFSLHLRSELRALHFRGYISN